MVTDTAWPAPSIQPPPVRHAPRPQRVRRAVVAVLLAGLLSAMIGLDHPSSSIGAALATLVLVAATLRAGIVSGAAARVVLIGVAALVPWFAVRASPWLLVPDAIAAMALIGLGLSMRNGTGATDSAGGYLRRADRLVMGVLETPRHMHLGVQTTVSAGWRQNVKQIFVPAALGVFAAAAMSGILASGDAVFASYLDVGSVLGSLGGRFAAAVMAMVVVGAATGGAIASERRPPVPSRPRSAPRGAVVAMLPLCVVYVGFVVVQFSSLLLGAEYVRRRTGLTFAEYARSGFFQLVVVALVTFVGLLLLRPTVRSATGGTRTVLRFLALVATVCTVAMSVAAIIKLDLYADVFGLTMLRVYTTVFAGWLAVALTIAFASLFRLQGEWVIPVVAVTALCGVLAMNVVNPERVVADHNLTQTIDSDEFDITYLLNLSDDAVPSIIEHLDDLPAADREYVRERLCAGVARSTDGLDWNWSASTARSAIETIC